MWYISVGKKGGIIAEKTFFKSYSFKYYKHDWEKTEPKFFLGSLTILIEVRKIFRTNFIKLLLSDYTVYRIFFEKFLIDKV